MALGATIHAAVQKLGSGSFGVQFPGVLAKMSEIMVDITPYAIGIMVPVSRRIFYRFGKYVWWVTRQENQVIIPEYSPIPTTANTVITPPQKGMKSLTLVILQGSNTLARYVHLPTQAVGFTNWIGQCAYFWKLPPKSQFDTQPFFQRKAFEIFRM